MFHRLYIISELNKNLTTFTYKFGIYKCYDFYPNDSLGSVLLRIFNWYLFETKAKLLRKKLIII